MIYDAYSSLFLLFVGYVGVQDRAVVDLHGTKTGIHSNQWNGI